MPGTCPICGSIMPCGCKRRASKLPFRVQEVRA